MDWNEPMLWHGFQRATRRIYVSRILKSIAVILLSVFELTISIDDVVSQEASGWQLPRGVLYTHSVRQEPRPLHIHVITIDLRSEPDPEPEQERFPENPLDLGVDFRAPQLGLGD